MPEPQTSDWPRAMCFAHRGARAHAPENTLAAFALAFDLGAEAIECDVQATADGALVALHDDTLNRTTDGVGPVRERSLAEVRALNAGRRWHLHTRVPTLEETLALVWQRGRAINVEVKGEPVEEALRTATALVPLLHALAPAQRTRLLVSSFEPEVLRLLRREVAWVQLGALVSGAQWPRPDPLAVALELGATAVHPGASLVTPRLVERAHAEGLRVHVWTVNRLGNMRQLLAMGVDGIFSDYPERVVIARAGMPPHEGSLAQVHERT